MLTFWLLTFSVLYSFAIYPAILMALPMRRRGAHSRPTDTPAMTVIVAARNEEERIRTKILDIFDQEYPAERLEIIVVSDASTDNTEQFVREFHDRGVRLLRKESREGKEAAQAVGISRATGEILVFSDVATRMGPGSLMAMARAFSNAEVGAVSSEDRFESTGRGGEGAYVRYETALRRLESRRAGLVGLSGSFFAIRREVASDWRTDIPSDFVAALNSVRLGLRAVSEPEAHGIYSDLANDSDEFARKRRTAVRGMAALLEIPEVLNPFRFGLFSYQLFSHKLMRWAVPWCLIPLLIVSAYMAPVSWVARSALALQVLFYALALVAWARPQLRRYSLVRFPYYFVQVNAALGLALVDLLRGRRVVAWEPSRR